MAKRRAALESGGGANPDRPSISFGIVPKEVREKKEDVGALRRSLKAMSSPERWEWKQLLASGQVDASEVPDFDEVRGGGGIGGGLVMGLVDVGGLGMAVCLELECALVVGNL